MALNSGLVRVPGVGEVSIAPPGTPEPPDATSPLPRPWVGLGLSDEDGVTIEREVDKEPTKHWQQLAPARYILQSHELRVTSNFQETKAAVLSTYFGGMTFRPHANGQWRGEISAIPSGDVRALCVDWSDRISAIEVYHHRLYIARTDVSENEEAQLSRTQEAKWGITFAALADQNGSNTLVAWLTDDPAFSPEYGETPDAMPPGMAPAVARP
ncbi:hypothetical protein [Saccharopolyspora hattusasensis]|uniref:phage tail tube protein n=1 Tax=Saccharopolyspora hattusasensis TaxID=1128679 RepID=UPI003D98CC37